MLYPNANKYFEFFKRCKKSSKSNVHFFSQLMAVTQRHWFQNEIKNN